MRRWLNSASYAWRGVCILIKEERNARIEVVMAIIVIPLCFWLRISAVEWCFVLLAIGGIMSAEAINTSIERLSDVVSPQINPKIRDVKDLAAGGVFIISVTALLIGIIIIGTKLYSRFF